MNSDPINSSSVDAYSKNNETKRFQGREDFDVRMETLKAKRLILVAPKKLIYSTQALINHSDRMGNIQETSKKRITNYAKKIIEDGNLSNVPPISIIMIDGTPVVIDGNHRARAIGMVNANENKRIFRKKLGSQIVAVTCKEYDLNEFLTIMDTTKEEILAQVEYARATYVEAEQRTKFLKGIPVTNNDVKFRPNLGTGISEDILEA